MTAEQFKELLDETTEQEERFLLCKNYLTEKGEKHKPLEIGAKFKHTNRKEYIIEKVVFQMNFNGEPMPFYSVRSIIKGGKLGKIEHFYHYQTR